MLQMFIMLWHCLKLSKGVFQESIPSKNNVFLSSFCRQILYSPDCQIYIFFPLYLDELYSSFGGLKVFWSLLFNALTFKHCNYESSHPGSVEMNPTRSHELADLIPGLIQWIWRCRELRCRSQTRLGSRVAVAVCRPVATAPVGPLAWEPPYVSGVALQRKKKW